MKFKNQFITVVAYNKDCGNEKNLLGQGCYSTRQRKLL